MQILSQAPLLEALFKEEVQVPVLREGVQLDAVSRGARTHAHRQ